MSNDGSNLPTFASFYDFYDGPEYRKDQLEMYRSLASEVGGPILDLACGTGIVTIDLARAGFDVTGLDISSDMLQVAQDKIDSEVKPRVTLVQGDMKGFQLGKKFRAAFIPSNSFGHLTLLDDQRSCLRAIHRHLEPGGLLVIEERNYTPEVLLRLVQNRAAVTTQMARVNPATGRHTTFNWATAHIDFVTQTISANRFIEEIQDDGTVKRYVPPGGMHRTHYFNRFELQLLIEEAGFKVRDLWGRHDRQPLGPTSYNMIFVATRARS